MIRVILFDLDGTLVDRWAADQRYCRDLLSRRPDVFDPENNDRDLAILLRESNRDARGFARRAARAFPGLGTQAEIAADRSGRLPAFIEADEGVVRMLGTLAQRHRLAVVTNGSDSVQRAKLVAAGLEKRFERVFVSAAEGAAKPHPPLFRRALDWAGAEPAETLFVGDDPEIDIAGAGRVGMRTCWISRGRPFPAGLPRPDLTIEHATGLPEVLR